MPDEPSADPKVVVEQVAREIARIGNDQKKAHDDLQREIGQLRQTVEDVKGNEQTASNQRSVFESKFTNLEHILTAAAKRQEDQEKQYEQLAAAYRRGDNLSAGGGDDELKEAIEFSRAMLSQRGIDPRTTVDPETVDRAAYQAYRKSFQRVLRTDPRNHSPEEVRTLMVGSDPSGGYLVPPAMSNRIITQVFESSPLRQLATVETIGTDAIELPVDLGEFEAGWVGETQPRPETATSTLGTKRILVHEIYAQPAATQKFLEDATIDVERWVADKIADRFGRLEATAFMLGDGINKPRGLLTYPAGTAYGQIERVNTGAAALPWFAPGSLVTIPFSLKEPYHSGSSWLFRRSSLAHIVTLTLGAGAPYLFQLALTSGGTAAANTPSAGNLVGYPVRTADDMPAPVLNGIAGAFGNFRQAYTVLDRLGITTVRDALTLKPFVLFYTRRRVGGDVVQTEAIKFLVVAS